MGKTRFTDEEIRLMIEEDFREETELCSARENRFSGLKRAVSAVLWILALAIIALIGFLPPSPLRTIFGGKNAERAGWTRDTLFRATRDSDSSVLQPGTLYRVGGSKNDEVIVMYFFQETGRDRVPRTSFVNFRLLSDWLASGAIVVVSPDSPEGSAFASEMNRLDGQMAIAGR